MKIAVGICTCGRNRLLASLLKRLRDIETGPEGKHDIFLIVADNLPGHGAREICDEIRPHLPVDLVFVEEPQRGISFARNAIVGKALDFDVDGLAFIDDDDEPQTDWLLHLLKRQAQTNAEIIMGNRVYRMPDDLEGSLKDRIQQPKITQKTKMWKVNGLPHQLSTCNVLICKEVLRCLAKKGPVFDPIFALMGGGDADFFCRARLSGATFARAQESYISYRVWPDRATAKGLFKRKFKGGCSQGVLMRRYATNKHRLRWLGNTLFRMTISLTVLPFDYLQKRSEARSITKIGWTLGAFWGFAGGHYDYYRNDLPSQHGTELPRRQQEKPRGYAA